MQKKSFCPHGMPPNKCIVCTAAARCEHGAPLTCVECKQVSYKPTLSKPLTSKPQRNIAQATMTPGKQRQGRNVAAAGAPRSTNALGQDPRQVVVDHIASKHAIVRRSVWGTRRPSYSAMDPDWDYTTIVIHHSGNGGETDPKQIEHKHMVDRKWDDVGYHYLIPPSGTIYEGCDLRYKGSHVEMANTQKIGILMMGDFDANWWDFDDEPTKAQLNAAVALIKSLKTEFGTITRLGGHRDYKKGTECPGSIMYSRIGALRSATGLGGP